MQILYALFSRELRSGFRGILRIGSSHRRYARVPLAVRRQLTQVTVVALCFRRILNEGDSEFRIHLGFNQLLSTV